MAGIGLTRPYYAKYHYDEDTGAVTYSGGGILGQAIEFSAKVESADDNILYANNGPAEVDTAFGGGTVSITTDDLTAEASMDILGMELSELLVGSKTVHELIFDERRRDQDLGFGVIIEKKRGGLLYYRAVVLPKIKFNIPEDSAKTREKKIEWQTPKVEGTIMRDDTEFHAWKREAEVPTEALARAYIEQILNIQKLDATLSALTLGSIALTPAFDPAVTAYTAATANATNTITATPTGSGATVEIRVNGATSINGSAATWTEGDNTVAITVTNGAAKKVYTVTITKTTVDA